MHIAFKIQKSSERVWHVEKYLKMLDFSKKRDKTSRLLRNTQQISLHMYRSFGIIHVKCYVRMYLVYVFFRKDSMKVNMDKIRQYEGSRKKYNPNR